MATRVPLTEANEVGSRIEQAWWEDARGVRTAMSVTDYNAGVFPRAMATAARGKQWDTASGYVEDNTVCVVGSDRYVCLDAKTDDIVRIVGDWRTGTQELREGVRIVDGELVRDDPRAR